MFFFSDEMCVKSGLTPYFGRFVVKVCLIFTILGLSWLRNREMCNVFFSVPN